MCPRLVVGTVGTPASVPCAHMEGADDILTPEEGLNEEPGPLTTRVSLQEVRGGDTATQERPARMAGWPFSMLHPAAVQLAVRAV